MSVNPLFSGTVPNKRPAIYNNSVSPGNRAAASCILRQSNLNPSNMNFGGSPVPRKRPRVGDARAPDPKNESDPFKDFNDTFTEDDLETFDMIASQAFSQQPRPVHNYGQEQERPFSTPIFQPKTNPAGSCPTLVGSSTKTNANQTASSVYGSLQQSNGAGNSNRFSVKPTINRGGPAVRVASTHAPASAFPKQAANSTHARQTNVVGTKIYYPHSSQHRSGGTPPGSQLAGNVDSTNAQTLRPSRQTAQPKASVQSNVGPKTTTSSTSKPEPYSSTSIKSTGNPASHFPLGFQMDSANKSAPLSYSENAEINPHSSNAGRPFYSNTGVGGGGSTTSLTPPKGSIARESPGLPTTVWDSGPSHLSALQQQQLEKYKKECEMIRHQMKRLAEEQLTKDGEIQVLRQNLTKVKAESSHFHQERLRAEEQRRLQSGKLEKDLKKEIESLQTQLQFKEMELMQAHSASQNHPTRPPVPTTPSHAPATPPRRPAASAPHSADEAKDAEMFPTQQSFMADNPKVDKGQLRSPRVRAMSEDAFLSKSPRTSPGRSSAIKSPGKMSPGRPNSLPSLGSSSSAQPSKPPRRRNAHCLMSARCQEAFSADAEIVGSLLQDQDAYVESTAGSVGGLMGLVQSSAVCERISREGVDPAQPSTSKDKRLSPSRSPSSDLRKQTSSLNVELATRAISNLLNPPRIPPLPPSVAPTSELTAFHPFQSAQTAAGSATCITDILPLLEDQLTRYVDTVRCITLKNASPLCSTCPSSGSGGSRTLESSYDSPGPSSPIEDSVNLGHAEAAALTSLALLRHMVTSSTVVRTGVLIGSIFRDSEPPISDDDMEIDPSAPLIDPTQAPGKSTAVSVTKPSPEGAVGSANARHTNHILGKLMRIASMQHGLGNCGAMVELSLAGLSALARKCGTEECQRLESVLVHNALYSSMSPECTLSQALHALDILSSLSASWELACKLCNQSDTCLLLQCYQCGVHAPRSCTTSQKLQLTVKVISLLRRIVLTHHQGAEMLLETDCQCSIELINAAVLMLRRVLDVNLSRTVYEHPTQNWRRVLHEALMLLHCLAVHDRNFHYHRLDVEKFHVYSITSLIKLYLKIPDITENETGLLQDLWDFDPWDDTEWEEENEPQEDPQGVVGNEGEGDQ